MAANQAGTYRVVVTNSAGLVISSNAVMSVYATAAASLTPPGRDDVDVSGMDVDIISEPITVTAQVQSCYTFQEKAIRRLREKLSHGIRPRSAS